MIRIERIDVDDDRFPEIEALDRALLADSSKPSPHTDWWIAWDEEANALAGYAGAIVLEDGAYFLSRAGVAPTYRGRGLQRRLIRARVRRGLRYGAHAIITYTVTHNAPSSNNLIASGFVTYWPSAPYVGDDVIYWWYLPKKRRASKKIA